jgi:hypothetical protein
MPYVSAAEREQANWRTLIDAVAHVTGLEKCSRDEARRQISSALADGNLWPLQWKDGRTPRFGSPGGLTMALDIPPQKWSEAQLAEIDWAEGTALDRSEFSDPPRRRALLIHKGALERWWHDKRSDPGPAAHEPEPAVPENTDRGRMYSGKSTTPFWDKARELHRAALEKLWYDKRSESAPATDGPAPAAPKGAERGRMHGGKKAAPFWDNAREEAGVWLEEEGCPRPGDGNQAVLEGVIAEWLAKNGYNASESSVRRHVSRWIAEYRKKRGIRT